MANDSQNVISEAIDRFEKTSGRKAIGSTVEWTDQKPSLQVISSSPDFYLLMKMFGHIG